MTAIVQTRKTGPRSETPAEAVVGGQVVEARSASRVGVAAAGSLKTVGIAITDGINPEALVTTPAGTPPVLNAAPIANYIDVAYGGIEVDGIIFAAAAAFGDRLKAAALGQVTPMAAGDDPRMEVGTCVTRAGVAATATGRVRTK